MAAALECWSSRASTDEDMVEQVLMRTNDRSECPPENNPSSSSSSASSASAAAAAALRESSAFQKRFQRLSRNVSEAIASFKNTLNLDSPREPPVSGPSGCRRHVWGSVVRSLTQLYPGSQLPEKLVSNIRRHYDSLPLSYAQAGFEMKDVFLHMKLIEQASASDQPAIMIRDMSDEEGNANANANVFKLTFACNSAISWPSMSGTLDSSSICCKKLQIFEKKGFTLGVVVLSVQAGQDKAIRTQIENALKAALKRPKNNPIKLPFGLCGCQDQRTKGRDPVAIDEDCNADNNNNVHGGENSESMPRLIMPLPDDSIVVSVDEWQTVTSGRDGIGRWLLNHEAVEITDSIGASTFKGMYKGKKVVIEKLKGCDKGNAYEFELRKDFLELMTCGHKNILPFHGVCVDENQGLCIVTKLMEGGSVYELILKNKKLQMRDILRIVMDVAVGIKFLNDHGVAYRDLNTQRILLDKRLNACLGDMGIVAACNSVGEAMEYETDGYRWLAPEIISGDPESVTETWMSNSYSFGMVLWEMVSGEIAYSAYSPVQAAVGIAACGLRPDIPESCPQILRNLMINCWNNCPSKRPQFSEIISILSSLSKQ
ncbi:Protein kinase superfamily protein [Striga hermonthica]|uniref:Protein kinase superfamily protein n=1 Tax=Striga hermonthica TaxID=68872 RepID=A0A9N7R7G8_STRHE|nr:Protein kinase superfamily protein [Striga hermonthica]